MPVRNSPSLPRFKLRTGSRILAPEVLPRRYRLRLLNCADPNLSFKAQAHCFDALRNPVR